MLSFVVIVASAQDWTTAQVAGSNRHKAKGESGLATLLDHLATVSQRAAESGASERKAVAGMLADFADWIDRAIAKYVGVAHSMVSATRSPEVSAQQRANKKASAARQVESDSTAKPDAKRPELLELAPIAAGRADPIGVALPAGAEAATAADEPSDADPRDQRIAELVEQVENLARSLTETVDCF